MVKWNQEFRRTMGPIVSFFIIYMILFEYVEKLHPVKLHIIQCSLDHYIPFVEVFVVPYLLWFLYIGATAVILFLKDFDSFIRFCYATMFGMALFIVVSFVYPNGLELRPQIFTRDNIFIRLTRMVYETDTPTNVLPSIHVYNSICALFATLESRWFEDKPVLRYGSGILAVSICLSTMFLKQHSIVDVLLGLVLSLIASEVAFHGLPEQLVQRLEMTRGRWAKEFSNLRR